MHTDLHNFFSRTLMQELRLLVPFFPPCNVINKWYASTPEYRKEPFLNDKGNLFVKRVSVPKWVH